MNLAVNARDAMPGGGRLTIETQRFECGDTDCDRHPAPHPVSAIVLVVSDTGIGMDEATRLRAFEPFFTTKEVGKGTGLGLSTVQGIVEQSGGWIEVSSEPGCGACFKVYLPVSGATARKQPVETVSSPGGSETILVVEDQAQLLNFTATALRSSGYRVIAAGSPEEALRIFTGKSRCIDLVLTDVVMPGMSGTDLAARLELLRPGVPILFMSGFAGKATVDDSLPGGGENLLEKPFSLPQLARKVRQKLGPPRRSRRVLVEHPDSESLRSLRAVLEQGGYQVVERTEPPPDAVLGELTLEQIKAFRDRSPDTRIILIAGTGESQGPELAAALGVDAVLPESPGPDVLLEYIRNLLD